MCTSRSALLLVLSFVPTLLSACSSGATVPPGVPAASSPSPPSLSVNPGDERFVVRSAQAVGMSEDGTAVLALGDYPAVCGVPPDPIPGRRTLVLPAPWVVGTHDLADVAQPKTLSTVGADYLPQSRRVAVTGTLEVLDAPTQNGAAARLRLRLSIDGEPFSGEVSAVYCVPPP
jgi:hypothetical protein